MHKSSKTLTADELRKRKATTWPMVASKAGSDWLLLHTQREDYETRKKLQSEYSRCVTGGLQLEADQSPAVGGLMPRQRRDFGQTSIGIFSLNISCLQESLPGAFRL